MSTARIEPAKGGVSTLRRIISYLLLFVMVVIAAIGLSGLVERMLTAASTVVAQDTGGLAQSLAFSLIAGPLAAVLWWLVWRAIARDRASVAWALYLTLTLTVSLLTFTIALFSWGAGLLVGDWRAGELATGIVWALVWLWHRWMWQHRTQGPTRLVGVAPAIASLIGLVMGASGTVSALGGLVAAAVQAQASVTFGSPWWTPVLQSLVWAVGGGLVWLWHWRQDRVREQTTGFSRVLLVFITGFGALGLTLYGVARTLYSALRLIFDPAEPFALMIGSLGEAIAAALVGAVILLYHRSFTAEPDALRHATSLVTSGLALAVAASGVGVIVNSILAAVVSPLADSGVRPLLLGGISALVVGGPVWWASWRPLTASARPSTPGRRIYLVVVFGVSAVVALVTLLVIGYQLFAFALDATSQGSLLDRIRQALGLLTATVLVASYHFALWRRDRATAEVAPGRKIDQVVLVTGSPDDALAAAIREATGARVTSWRRAEAEGNTATTDQVIAALDGLQADRVLLIAGPGDRVEAIAIED